jgi:YfiH family protein
MRLKHPTIPPLSKDSSQYTATKPGLKATTYRYERLSQFEELSHEVFTRHGGISKAPFDSLNVSDETGDNPENVQVNLRIVMGVMGTEQLCSMNQIHGKDISLCGEDLDPVTPSVVNGDAIISNQSNVALMVKSADCQAIILFDPIKRVVANVHCGWRGNRLNIVAAVVARMKSDFQCKPSRILAGIGPSLGPCCAEFITHEEIFPKHFDRFMVRRNYFDLWRLSRWQLLEAGLNKENIEIAGICTRCRTDLFYSYRGEGNTGRFATVVMLKQ